jgi:hypothetical protein
MFSSISSQELAPLTLVVTLQIAAYSAKGITPLAPVLRTTIKTARERERERERERD